MENKWKKILEEFKKLKFPERELTYLELCRYPRARFEEICSRILEFFFNPKEIHGMGDLWLKSLFNAIKVEPIPYGTLSVITEEQADGKRIDITIIGTSWKGGEIDSDNSFVIAIENKVDAELYNPLEVYAKYVDNEYKDYNRYKVVLSLKKQHSEKAEENNFICITYEELFNKVMSNAAEYLLYNNSPYKMIMGDFIKTLRNMENLMSDETIKFFRENHGEIDKLIAKYDEYKHYVSTKNFDRFKDLADKLNKELKDELKDDNIPQWVPWNNELISVMFKDSNGRELYLEAQYEDLSNLSSDNMIIWIKTKTMNAWSNDYRVKAEENSGNWSKDNLYYHINNSFSGEELLNKCKALYKMFYPIHKK